MSIASEISRLQQAKEDLATAIGNKGVTVSVSATLDDFADYVDDIVTGITPTGTKSITTNGTHDVTNYASASVAVPASAVDSGTKSITTNGTHDVVGYASASVNVPSSSPTLISKSITANGTYNASADSADGYSSVTVNVPSSGGATTCTLSISDDGIVASNFSSGSTPTSFIACGFDDTNGLCATYCKDAYTDGCIMWYDQLGAYYWATGDVFPTLYSCNEGISSHMDYSVGFQDTSFTATVTLLT